MTVTDLHILLQSATSDVEDARTRYRTVETAWRTLNDTVNLSSNPSVWAAYDLLTDRAEAARNEYRRALTVQRNITTALLERYEETCGPL